MKYCPNCGAAAEDGQKFCSECGAKLAFEPLPAEPVYTEDERLKNDPVLNPSPDPAPGERRKREKVPELTLEPDLWGMGAAAAAAAPAEPAKPAEPAQKAARAEDALKAVEKQGPTVISNRTEDYDYEQPGAEYHGPAQGSHGDYRAPRQQSYETLPDDSTATQAPGMSARKMPDETLMLVWSIVLTCLFSVCGIVGLVKTIKARKTMDPAMKYKLLSSAKIWLIAGTILHVLPFLGNLF